MHAKNSIPDNEFSIAKSATFLSAVAAPTSTMFVESSFIYENAELSFTVIPLIPPSLISVFDPAPKIVNFCGLSFSNKEMISLILLHQV